MANSVDFQPDPVNWTGLSGASRPHISPVLFGKFWILEKGRRTDGGSFVRKRLLRERCRPGLSQIVIAPLLLSGNVFGNPELLPRQTPVLYLVSPNRAEKPRDASVRTCIKPI